jgi:predicted negative regulator of RcsB-dependent stress response
MAAEGIGTAELSLGHIEAAREAFVESLAVRREALGSDHVYVALSIKSLGLVAHRSGDYEEALRRYDESLVLLETHGDDGRRFAADSHQLRGDTLMELSREEEAAAAYEASLQISADGAEPFRVALTRFLLARALHAVGQDPARVRMLAEQTRKDIAESRDPDSDKARADVEAFLAELDE